MSRTGTAQFKLDPLDFFLLCAQYPLSSGNEHGKYEQFCRKLATLLSEILGAALKSD